MAEALKIRVEARDPAKNKGTGSRVVRRLRKEGRIPAVIYGHKQEVVPISLSKEDVWHMIKGTSHLAELDLGSKSETVLIRDVQWDNLGREILHLDFARVSAEEQIETEVKIEIRGQAAGLADGGVLEQIVHTLSIKCPAASIPDSIRIDVSGLGLDQSIHVRDLQLPANVVADADGDLLILHIVTPRVAEEPAAGEGAEAATQPEVIKPERKEKDKED